MPHRRVDSVQDWQKLVATEMSPVTVHTRQRSSFEVALRVRRSMQANLLHILGTPQHFSRTCSQARIDEPRFSVAVQLEGRGYAAQRDNEALLEPGDLALFDWSVPHTREFDGDFAMFTMLFPQHLMRLPEGAVEAMCGARIDGSRGLGSSASALLRSLARDDVPVETAPGAHVVHSAVQVAAGAITEAFEASRGEECSRRAVLAEQVRDSVRGRLDDPDLCPEAIARMNFMSVRTLHKIFAAEGQSVSAWVREQRLEQACRDLEDPAQSDLPVQEIAARWGFGGPSQFSRAFRRAYGCTPAEHRRRWSAGRHTTAAA